MKSRIALKLYFALNPKVFSKTNPVPPRIKIAIRPENPGPYRKLLGKTLRVGYYGKQDGLNVIWIVFPDGKYGETTTHAHLNRHFQILDSSHENDLFGELKPMLTAISFEESAIPAS